ncbi:serine hydrolase [Nocardia sp. CS682]|uniref:serine hydrolase domain-containing protein n=1 Tax=Nocardia sp. CS682 TaxID=1047172 RepID=UPI001074BD1F|nr:serine hydrolase domain-containing protein [Nocardia sp. CS682]QBS44849.1 hypothetical protein DMB37_37010 [Nocardia sp. CS682]
MTILLRCVAWLAAVLVVAGCTAAPETSGRSGEAVRPYGELDRFVRDKMRSVRIPGAAYAIVDRDGIRHTGTFGTDGDGAAVNATTPFLWGSVAKPVTATLVMIMVAAGELRLDASVATYLPSFRTRDHARSARITVRQLINQTSGLPTSTRHTDRTDAHRRPADVLPELEQQTLAGEPGVAHRYSSTNYLLLAAVVEAVTGKPFTDVLYSRVLDPLAMRTTITTQAQAQAAVSRGHRYIFDRPVPMTPPFDPAGVGYGYLGGALADLAAFARTNLGGGTEIIDKAQRDTMFAGDIPTSPGKSYGLGWRRWTVPGADTPMIWHGGAAPGYWAQIILLPEQAIVLLVNSYGTLHEPKLLNVGFGLAALSIGHAPPEIPSGQSYTAILGALAALIVILIGLIGHGIRRLVHPKTPAPKRWRSCIALAAWILAPGAILYGLAAALPARMGITLPQLMLWTPDIAGLIYLTLAATTMLLLIRLAHGIRALRPSSASHIEPSRPAES